MRFRLAGEKSVCFFLPKRGRGARCVSCLESIVIDDNILQRLRLGGLEECTDVSRASAVGPY